VHSALGKKEDEPALRLEWRVNMHVGIMFHQIVVPAHQVGFPRLHPQQHTSSSAAVAAAALYVAVTCDVAGPSYLCWCTNLAFLIQRKWL
jgi:hypothetical protein